MPTQNRCHEHLVVRRARRDMVCEGVALYGQDDVIRADDCGPSETSHLGSLDCRRPRLVVFGCTEVIHRDYLVDAVGGGVVVVV